MIKFTDHKTLSKVLDHFVPGMSGFVTPIKMELLTPSQSCLLYRTIGRGGKEHFFVCVVYDQLRSLSEAEHIVESWHGQVIEFVKPTAPAIHGHSDLDRTCSRHGDYWLVLARVAKPKGAGYWSTNATIMPGDSINEKLAHLNLEEREEVADKLKDVLVNKVKATETFLNNYKVKSNETLNLDDINTSDVAATVFITQTGKQEIFYSYAPSAEPSKNILKSRQVKRISRRG